MYRDTGSPITIRWEYKSVVVSTNSSIPKIDKILNGSGSDGWELVSFAATHTAQLLFVLKRQLM